MASSLIEIMSDELGSDQASVTLTGMTSEYEVYLFVFNNVIPTVADADLLFQFTESGSPNTTANYDYAFQYLRSDTSEAGLKDTNRNFANLSGSMENDAGTGGCNGFKYIFNATNSDEYTLSTIEANYLAEDGTMLGAQGGYCLTVTSVVDGGKFYFDSGNIRSGAKFVLYGLKK
jgi:hypothetical protein